MTPKEQLDLAEYIAESLLDMGVPPRDLLVAMGMAEGLVTGVLYPADRVEAAGALVEGRATMTACLTPASEAN